MAPSPLCQICMQIPFDRDLGKTWLYMPDSKEWDLGLFGEVRRRDCPFCQLVASACEEDLVWPHNRPPRDDRPIKVKCHGQSFIPRPSRLGTWILAASDETPSQDILKARCTARESLNEWIDFDEIKRWIERCDHRHKDKTPACTATPFNAAVLPRLDRGQLDFRLIDVDEMSITYAPRNARYVTLSYVWGQTDRPRLKLNSNNEEALMQAGALNRMASEVPATIWDAILVVRGLGERYLWVDSLCILQDDQQELQECVAVMDLFYEMAVLTIIAGGGADAFAGLEGVAPQRKRVNVAKAVDIVPGLKMTVLRDVDNLLQMSAYRNRAWVMQEEILSRRALIFIAGQVYWKCKHSYLEESLSWQGGEKVCHSSNSHGTLYYAIFDEDEASFRDFEDILMYYMNKQLSFDTDILRAAQGMLRKFSALSGVLCFQGLPSPLGAYMLFTINSDWSRAFGRRHGFPSYSWTGWKSNPHYRAINWRAHQNYRRYNSDGWIRWFCKFPNGQIFRISESGRLRRATVAPQYGDAVPDAPIEFRDLDRPVGSDDLNPIRPISYPHLLFWTVVVNLRLKPKTIPVDWGFPQEYVNYEPLGKHGYRIGEDVSMDVATSPDEMMIGKFALLTASDTWFHALLLHWKDGIAERRGVVSLYKSVIDGCLEPGPRWRAIVMG